MRKKVLVATIFMVILVGMAVVPSAKADTFVYHVTNSADGLSVTFDLPTFENPANNITTFVSGTLAGLPLTAFGISGNSSECADAHVAAVPGPCWVGNNTSVSSKIEFTSPSFTGPGTFTLGSTTVTITDVPTTAPEPSSLALVPLGLVALLLMRKRAGHFRPSAV